MTGLCAAYHLEAPSRPKSSCLENIKGEQSPQLLAGWGDALGCTGHLLFFDERCGTPALPTAQISSRPRAHPLPLAPPGVPTRPATSPARPCLPARTFLTYSPHLPCAAGRRHTRELPSPGHCAGGLLSHSAWRDVLSAARERLSYDVWVFGVLQCCAFAIGPDVRCACARRVQRPCTVAVQ